MKIAIEFDDRQWGIVSSALDGAANMADNQARSSGSTLHREIYRMRSARLRGIRKELSGQRKSKKAAAPQGRQEPK